MKLPSFPNSKKGDGRISTQPPPFDPKYAVERVGPPPAQHMPQNKISTPTRPHQAAPRTPLREIVSVEFLLKCQVTQRPFIVRANAHADGSVFLRAGIAISPNAAPVSSGGAAPLTFTITGGVTFASTYHCPYCASRSFIGCSGCEKFSCDNDNLPAGRCPHCHGERTRVYVDSLDIPVKQPDGNRTSHSTAVTVCQNQTSPPARR